MSFIPLVVRVNTCNPFNFASGVISTIRFLLRLNICNSVNFASGVMSYISLFLRDNSLNPVKLASSVRSFISPPTRDNSCNCVACSNPVRSLTPTVSNFVKPDSASRVKGLPGFKPRALRTLSAKRPFGIKPGSGSGIGLYRIKFG